LQAVLVPNGQRFNGTSRRRIIHSRQKLNRLNTPSPEDPGSGDSATTLAGARPKPQQRRASKRAFQVVAQPSCR
jgi:hypothetical protein